jgi:hypothetical protein
VSRCLAQKSQAHKTHRANGGPSAKPPPSRPLSVVLSPETVVVGADHAMLHASLMPSENRQLAAAMPSRLPAPLMLFTRRARRKQSRQARRRNADAAVATLRALAQSADIAVADDRGVRYALHPAGTSAKVARPEKAG